MSSNHSSTLFGLFVSWFWYNCLIWICCVFYPLVLFIFSLSSYLCLDLHKFLFTNSIVFFFWYILLFFPDLQNPLFCITLCWLFCLRKLFSHIGNFWSSGLCKIEVLQKRQKKESVKKSQLKKNDKYYKNSVQIWRYSWCNWTLILENLF